MINFRRIDNDDRIPVKMKTKKKLECLQQLNFQRGTVSNMAEKIFLPRSEADKLFVDQIVIKTKIKTEIKKKMKLEELTMESVVKAAVKP